MIPRQAPNYDSAWALWRLNDQVASDGLNASEVRIARRFFLLGVQAALDQLTERASVARCDAMRVLDR